MQNDLFVEDSKHIEVSDSTYPWSSSDMTCSVEEHWKDDKGCGWRKFLYNICYYETSKKTRKKIINTMREYYG